MSVEDYKALVRRFYEAVSTGDDATVDALVSEDVVDHNPVPGLPSGREGAKQLFAASRAAFVDWRVVPENVVAEGDKVVARVTVRGVHQGNFMGIPPTGREIAMTGMEIVRVVNGQLVERWGVFDQLGLLQQLGAIPSPE